MIFRGFPSPSPSAQAPAELTVAQDTMSGDPVPSGARVLVLFPPWLWSGHTSLLMLLEPAGSLPLNPSVLLFSGGLFQMSARLPPSPHCKALLKPHFSCEPSLAAPLPVTL